MNLVTQIQGVGYSFVFGLVFSFIYHFIHRCFIKCKQRLFRLCLQIVIGVVFGIVYYYGLLVINEGLIRMYFLAALLFGYIVYQNYYSHKMMVIIEKMVKWLKYVFSPLFFVFRKINAIMVKAKKVIRWQKKDSKKHIVE